MNEIRLNFFMVIIFAAVGGVLLFVGLIFFSQGFDKTFSTLFIVGGLGLLLPTFLLAVESGFIEGKGTLASSPS